MEVSDYHEAILSPFSAPEVRSRVLLVAQMPLEKQIPVNDNHPSSLTSLTSFLDTVLSFAHRMGLWIATVYELYPQEDLGRPLVNLLTVYVLAHSHR